MKRSKHGSLRIAKSSISYIAGKQGMASFGHHAYFLAAVLD